ncbi:MAG: hypothetical protein HQL21_08760 [Candidatus Omnitrophica bacterium]|nr:hypothetical protein [Candidatus Omnitrophota bacterium]
MEQRDKVITEVREDRAAAKLKSSDKTGGIDFNTEHMNIQTAGSGAGIKFRIDPATLQQWEKASGVSAVIISIQPLNSLKAFLGANVEEPSLVSG